MLAFDRFTANAQDMAARAYEISQRYGSEQVGSAHILLALLEQPDGVVPQILAKLEIEPAPLKLRLNDVLSGLPKAAVASGTTGRIFIGPHVKRCLDLADEKARGAGAVHISSEHLFFGLLAERDTPVAGILADAGITTARVEQVLQNN